MSSDSDDEVGRTLDYSSSSDEKPKKKKKKEKPAPPKKPAKPPKPPKPVPADTPPPLPPQKQTRLTQARRNQIIQHFEVGREDPEYSVTKLSNGSYRVSKRKEFFTPTAAVETVTPKGSDIHLTWMNMQNEVNEGLQRQLKKLKTNYSKLAEKYEEKNTAPPVPEPAPPPKPVPIPVPKPEPIPPPTPVPIPTPKPVQTVQRPPPSKPVRRGRIYSGVLSDIRDY
jgi:hypothetical protein